MKAITLFSGIGGVACGFKMAGIDVIGSVELDPLNRQYSEDCQKMHAINFPGSNFYLNQVGEVADKLPACDLLQASTVCSNFSIAANMNNGRGETLQDTQMARDTVTAIKTCNPTHFLLEQVAGYQNTRSLKIIVDHLKASGYNITADVVELADYGIPQYRRRFFLMASKSHRWRFPAKRKRMGWLEAIAGVKLTRSHLTNGQKEALQELDKSQFDFEKGILVQRGGIKSKARRHDQPAWTITRSMFTDGRNPRTNRKEVMNFVRVDGCWKLPIRCLGRLGGFPDWFEFGEYGGQGIGYSVPPRFIKLLIESNLDYCTNLPETNLQK